MAASVGISIPRVRSATQCTSCLYAVCASSPVISAVYAPEPLPGQRHLHQLLHEACQVLGERLQVSYIFIELEIPQHVLPSTIIHSEIMKPFVFIGLS